MWRCWCRTVGQGGYFHLKISWYYHDISFSLILSCRSWSTITGNKVWRSMSSSESKRKEVTEQMWYAAEDFSRTVQQRLEKLGRRIGWQSGTGNRQFIRWSGTQTPSKLRLCWMVKFVGKVWRCQVTKTFVNQDGHAVNYCNVSAMELSASVIGVGAPWCGRTLMTRRRVVRPRSTPIASAVQGVVECQPTLHCNSPAAVAPDTGDWKTVLLGTERRMPRSRRNTAKQADVVFMTWDLIETSASV